MLTFFFGGNSKYLANFQRFDSITFIIIDAMQISSIFAMHWNLIGLKGIFLILFSLVHPRVLNEHRMSPGACQKTLRFFFSWTYFALLKNVVCRHSCLVCLRKMKLCRRFTKKNHFISRKNKKDIILRWCYRVFLKYIRRINVLYCNMTKA